MKNPTLANVNTLYIIEVQTSYVNRLFLYRGERPPTEDQIRLSHGAEAAKDVEGVEIYPLSGLAVLQIATPVSSTVREEVTPGGPALENYSIYIDQVETKLVEASSEDEALALFHNRLTLGRLLSMVRFSAEASCQEP
jgi:hypothetical protein